MRWRQATVGVLVLPLLAGCSWLGASGPRASVKSLRLVAFPAANGRMATAIDVVFVYRQEDAPALPRRAPEWFARKRELMGGAPGVVEVVSCELPPGQVMESVVLPARHGKAVQVIAYANHLEIEGQHAINLTPLRRAVLWVDAMAAGAVEEGQPIVPRGGE